MKKSLDHPQLSLKKVLLSQLQELRKQTYLNIEKEMHHWFKVHTELIKDITSINQAKRIIYTPNPH